MENLISPDGSLDLVQVNKLSYNDLGSWMALVLKGDFPPLRGGIDEYPHMFLYRVYRRLDPSVREAFRDNLLEMLGELSQEPRSTWASESGDELILLVSDVFQHAGRASDVMSYLLYLAVNRPDLHALDPDLHLRVLESIVSLGLRTSKAFWFQMATFGGAEYAPIVFTGLTMESLSTAFDWLSRQSRPPSTYQAVLIRIPWLLQTYGSDRVTQQIIRLLSSVPHEYQEQFRALANNLELPAVSGVFLQFSIEELLDLAKCLELEISEERNTRDAVIQSIEAGLISRSKMYQAYTNPSPDMKIISAIAEYTQAGQCEIDARYRQKIIEYGTSLQDKIANRDDMRQYVREITQLKYGGKSEDIAEEFQRVANQGRRGPNGR